MRPRSLVPVLVPMLLAAAALPLAQGTIARGAASPQEAVAAFKKAVAANDVAAALPLFSPAGLKELASEGVAGMLMILAFADPEDPMPGTPAPTAAQRKQYQQAVALVRQTLKPYGMDGLIGKPPLAAGTQSAIDAALGKADALALTTSLFATLMKIAPMLGMKETADASPLPQFGDVTDFSISGDTATARDGARTIDFVRVGGRWYLTPPSRSGGGGPAPAAASDPAPQAPATASGSEPEIVVGGIQVARVVMAADDFSARPFNAENGTRLVLWIKMPAGQGLIEIDDDASLLQRFSDDKGTDLGGRFDSFPDEFEDGTGGTFEIESSGMPAAGATALLAEGTLAMTVASGTSKTRVPKVPLRNDQTFLLGKTTITLADVASDSDSQSFTLKLPRQVMEGIRNVAFFDAAGAALEGRRTSRGYMNDAAEMGFTVETTTKTITLEFETWQARRTIKVPFKVKAGLGLN